MKIVESRYARLGPSLELLADEAVLAQAWKKTDAYIRRHNWYADILELEQTSLLLPERVQEWGRQLLEGTLESARNLRHVPAPKNAKWHFQRIDEGGGWRPKESLELRPLAHVAIREQVLASAVMLCVADAVETAQGCTDPSQYSSSSEMRKSVCSYGNRLFCDWRKAGNGQLQARFRWGNATTYSQFFKDYERFLARPAEVCRDVLPSLQDEKLFVIKLDLAKFYDHVSQAAVVPRLQAIVERYASDFGLSRQPDESGPFWAAARGVLSWHWHSDDLASRDGLRLGLPQGLVASGFLANAYMHDFDQEAMQQVRNGDEISVSHSDTTHAVRLLDYCRYVDDMRLVVALSVGPGQALPLEILAKRMSKWANKLIKSSLKGASSGLKVKPDKSEAIAWEDFAVQGSTSRFMRSVNGQISGAPDAATLLQATGSLDHLLWLADSLEEANGVDENPLALARIALPSLDVRDDTLKRFAANRLRQVLRMRRSMADPELPADDVVMETDLSELQALDHEMEAVARKLIACWSRNPALVTVLRCGLDIFPSAELLRPVLEALQHALQVGEQPERDVACYVLADLFRAGAVETGLHRPESYPERVDIKGYRRELMQAALEAIADAGMPWYVYQQAALFLAVMQYPVTLPEKDELVAYRALHDALRLSSPGVEEPSMALTAGMLVVKITGKRAQFFVWLRHWLQSVTVKKAQKLIDNIAMIDPTLLLGLGELCKVERKAGWIRYLSHYLPRDGGNDISERLRDWQGGKRALTAIVAHPENPFVQENALLKLAAELLSAKHVEALSQDGIGLDWLLVECKDWSRIQDPGSRFEIIIKAPGRRSNRCIHPWNEKPSWCAEDMAWAYRLGQLLRSAIIGESDFTTRFFPLREEQFDRYRGLQSSWYKRRMGLMPLSRGLGEEPTPISPWLNEMVMHLLQWPGLEISGRSDHGFTEIAEPSDLLRLITARLGAQARIFARQSNLPAYLLPVSCSPKTNLRAFKVALVQSLMPRDSDFTASDPLAWSATYRARHRAHLAAMCRLISQQLVASRLASRKADIRHRDMLDLIVFPELAVHPDDTWLLHRLSDKTGALIFAGQTFVEHPYLKKPINRAVWLLRQEGVIGRQIIRAYQGKAHGIPWEKDAGVEGHRPYQVLIQLEDQSGGTAILTGVICYDATDLKLAADMRDISDGFVIAALNKDIGTFDNMTAALQFHMHQPVLLSNTGQYGGSNAQAPYKAHHERQIAHAHGNNQAIVSLFEVDLLAFQSTEKTKPAREKKAAPAGYLGRVRRDEL